MRFNRKTFFDGYRELFGSLGQAQVDGLEFLLGKIEGDPNLQSIPQIAYVLATVQHETAQTFQPIAEYRARVGTKARKLQDQYWDTGFYGRGYVQLTHKANYERYGIASDPDKALEPETAYHILSDGMRKGVFTGKKLSDYINDNRTDYVNARRIVNGLDKADQIAQNARHFEAILGPAKVKSDDVITTEAEDKVEQKVEPPAAPQASPKPEVTPVEAPKSSIVTKIGAAASAAGPVLAATGLKIGGVEFKTGGLVAFAAVLIVGMIIAAWLWNQSQERAFERQKMSINNLADPERSNIVAAGSKV